MTKQIKLIQQRPNTAIAWHNADDTFKNLKSSYVSAGKLDDQGVVVSGNELIRTWTLVFTNEENYNEFLNEAASLDYNAARQKYNSDNGISESLDVQDI
jgi:hypothetical protein